MTQHVYRYRRDRPAAPPILQKLIGTEVMLIAVGNGAVFDLWLDDAFLQDADEVLAVFGFTRTETDPTMPADARRVVSSGSVTINANSTVTLGTFTRNAGERLRLSGFVTNNVSGTAFGESTQAGLSDAVVYFLDRTTNPNEFRARATNGNLLASRTLEWLVEAFLV